MSTGIVTNGLIGYWNYQQGCTATTWSNLVSGKTDYFALNSGVTIQSNGVLFDGVTGLGTHSATSSGIASGAAFTVELGYVTQNSADWGYIFGTHGTGTNSFRQNTKFDFYNNGTGNFSPITVPANNVPIIVTAVFDPAQGTGTMNWYANGSFANTYTISGTITLAEKLYIGLMPGGWKAVANLFQFVRIYNRALTASEITQNYNVGTAVGLPNSIVINNLIAYYNSKRGVNSTTWSNLALTGTKYDGTLDASAPPTVQSNGMTFSSTGTDVNAYAFDEFTNPKTNETIEFRIKLDTTTLQPIIADDYYNPIIYINGGTVLTVLLYDMYGNTSVYNFSGVYTSNEEDYFSLVLDTSTQTLTLYKNGTYSLDYTITSENSFFGAFASFYIGDQRNYYPTGVIDNVRFYTKALSSSEVQQNYYFGSQIGILTDITNLTETHNNNTVRLTWLNPQISYTNVNIYKNSNLLTILDNNNGGSYYDFDVLPSTTYNYKVTAIINGAETTGSTINSTTSLLSTNNYIIYRQNPDYSVQIKGEITENSGTAPFSLDSQGNMFISGELVEYYPATTYTYSEASNSFSNVTNNNATVSNNQLILSKTGTDINNTDNTSTKFATGTLSNVTTNGNSLVLTQNTLYNSVTEDFEDTTYNFSFSGTWTRTTATGTYYAGTGGWASPSKASGTTSITVNLGQASTISYWVKIIANTKSSTSFSIDGTTQSTGTVNGNGSTSGTTWAQKTFNLSAGSHTLQWSYTNGSGGATGAQQAYIDNIVVGGIASTQYASTGYRISSYDLSSASSVGSSTMSWTSTTPTGTSMTIQTSLDGGTTWSTVTNGITMIPGLTLGTNLSGKTLQVKQTLNASADLASTPTLSSLSFTVNSAYVSSGYGVFNVPINSINKVGSSTIDWNLSSPANTSFTVDVSTNNVNWTTNITKGGSIPVLTVGQSPPANIYVKTNLATGTVSSTPALSDMTINVVEGNSGNATQFQFDKTKLTTTELDENVNLT